MTEQPLPLHVPEWDTADRLRKSLRDANMGVQEMADYLGVARNTVSNWLNGHVTIPGPACKLWALRCGVPLEWLREGRLNDESTRINGRYGSESMTLTAVDLPLSA